MAAGGKAINLGELAIAIALKTGALEAGLNEVKKKLNQHSKDVQKSGAEYDKLAIVAGVAFWKISSAITGGVTAFNDFNNSMTGLKSIVQGTGNDFSKAQQFIDGFIKDGLVPANNAATALKNLLARGFSMGEAADVMNRLKDSAAFARQGALSMGQAIQGATEGLKNSNSVMIDNAGVTENLSIMWAKYAESIGKTASQLSDSEKVQAEYVGILRATQNQIGDAAKYADQFSGAQSRMTFEVTKLQQAFGGGLVTSLQVFYDALTPVISFLTSIIQINPDVVAGIALVIATFLGMITIATAVGSAVNMINVALKALNLTLAGFLLNPVVLAMAALAAVTVIVATQIGKAKKAQQEYNAALQEHNKIAREGISKSEIPILQEKVDKLKELSAEYDRINGKIKDLQGQGSTLDKVLNFSVPFYGILSENAQRDIDNYNTQLQDLTARMKAFGVTQKDINNVIKDYELAIKEANRANIDEVNSEARSIAQKHASIVETQNLIAAYKSAEQGSKEWYDAQQKLAEQFPQFASASGIQIKAIEDVATAQDLAVKAEWKLTQAKITMARMELEAIQTKTQGEIDALRAITDLSAADAGITNYLIGELDKATSKLNGINNDINALKALEGIDIDKMLGVKPLPGGQFKAYENEALDAALKIHTHKVRMAEMSAEEEIKSLESILQKYVKTADERMDLEERIYDAKQALLRKNQEAVEKSIRDEEEALENRTKFSFDWIDTQKQTSTFDSKDEIAAYNRIIKYHKEYLIKIMADTRLSDSEKKRIYNQEVDFIRDQQNKILDIQKANVEKAVNAYLDAKRKQYDNEERIENERLNAKLKALDREYRDRVNELEAADRDAELESLYAQERKYRNAATKEGRDHLRDIREQISRLERDSELDRLQTEKENKQEAIEDEIAANQSKYAQMKADLEKSGQEMLASAASYAKQLGDELGNAQNTAGNALLGIMQEFDARSTDLITQGMEKLRQLIENYKRIMESITIQPNFQLAGMPGLSTSGTKSGTGNGTNVIINDYGPKNLSGIDDIRDYGKELVTGAKNASRG